MATMKELVEGKLAVVLPGHKFPFLTTGEAVLVVGVEMSHTRNYVTVIRASGRKMPKPGRIGMATKFLRLPKLGDTIQFA